MLWGAWQVRVPIRPAVLKVGLRLVRECMRPAHRGTRLSLKDLMRWWVMAPIRPRHGGTERLQPEKALMLGGAWQVRVPIRPAVLKVGLRLVNG